MFLCSFLTVCGGGGGGGELTPYQKITGFPETTLATSETPFQKHTCILLEKQMPFQKHACMR